MFGGLHTIAQGGFADAAGPACESVLHGPNSIPDHCTFNQSQVKKFDLEYSI
jgi:hypothetical protein